MLARGEGVPLVLSRVASAGFTLKRVSPDCTVSAAARHLAGATQEPDEAIEAWEEVQCSSLTSWFASVGLACGGGLVWPL